jgi:hypothetical protein
MQFTDETKQVKEFNDNYFGYGVHRVQIAKVTLDETTDGKEFMEIEVVGADGQEDSARVWFTSDKAANYSFSILHQIVIHNTPEDKRDVMRANLDALPDTPALAKLCQGLIGKECWFTKYVDPERTYQDKQGNTRQSVNKNVYGYEPKLKPELLPKNGPVDMGALGIGKTDNAVPFESAGDAAGAHVPADDAWAN